MTNATENADETAIAPDAIPLPPQLQRMFDTYLSMRALAAKAAMTQAAPANDNDNADGPAIVIARQADLPATSAKPYFRKQATARRQLGKHHVRALGSALAEAAGVCVSAVSHIDIVVTFGVPEHTYVARVEMDLERRTKRAGGTLTAATPAAATAAGEPTKK